MANKGTLTETIRTGYELKIVWNIDHQSIPNNTSTVVVKVQLVSTGSSYAINSTAPKSGTLYIDGKAYAFSFSAALSANQTKTIFTKTAIVLHDSDGTKTCAFRADVGLEVTLSGTYYGTVTISGDGTFKTISRASNPSLSASSVTMGASITISIKRASNEFRHDLIYTFGNQSGTIATNVTTSATWELPLTLALGIPKSTSGTGVIICKTYDGSSLIGSKSVNFTASVPESIIPSIESVSISEATPNITVKFGAYVQNKSTLNVEINANGVYGSTIEKYETTIQGMTYHKSSFVSELITSSGAMAVITKVTDSRGRTTQVANSVTVQAYSNPEILAFSAYRCNSTGAADSEGSNLKIEFNYSICSVNNKNDKSYEIIYREKGASTWETIASGNAYAQNTNIISDALFDPNTAYDLRLNIEDYFSGAVATINVLTSFTLIDFRSTGKGIEFGGVSNEDCFGVSIDAKFRKNVNVTGVFSAANIKCGSDSITPTAANTATSKQITFAEPFPSGTIPTVFISAETSSPGTVVKGISIDDPSSTGFTAWIIKTDTAETTFNWLAIGG